MARWGVSAVVLLLAFSAGADAAGAHSKHGGIGRTPGFCELPWRIVFGSANDDRIFATTRDVEGDFYVAGFEHGLLGVENFWPVGDSAGFVRKLSPAGMLMWSYEFDTAGIDIVDAIATTSDGSVLVAGRTDAAFPGFVNAGQLDLFVARLSPEGALVALGQFGNERPQHPAAVRDLGNGRIVVGGYDDVYVEGNAVVDRENAFVASFAASGAGLAIEWWLQSVDPAIDRITALEKAGDASGDVLVGRLMDKPPATGGGIFVTRVSRDGTVLWDHALSQSGLDYVAGLSSAGAGSVYVAGTTILPLDGPALGNSDGFVEALDATSGARKWGVQFGSDQGEWVSQLAADDAGDVALVGYSEGTVAPGHPAGNLDPFVYLISASGVPVGAWQGAAGAQTDYSYAIATTGCIDAFAVAGSLAGIAPPANLGRTDAELTVVRVERFESVMTSGFDP
jgi:outer membrane protein assembly factor BamB